MLKVSIYSYSILSLFLSSGSYCMMNDFINNSEDNIHYGPSIPNKTFKKPQPIGQVYRTNIMYDEKRGSYYQGDNLSSFPINSDVDEDHKHTLQFKLIQHARGKYIDTRLAKKSDPNPEQGFRTIYILNSKDEEIKLLYIKQTDLSNFFSQDLPPSTLPIRAK